MVRAPGGAGGGGTGAPAGSSNNLKEIGSLSSTCGLATPELPECANRSHLFVAPSRYCHCTRVHLAPRKAVLVAITLELGAPSRKPEVVPEKLGWEKPTVLPVV